jgi:peptide deformylase
MRALVTAPAECLRQSCEPVETVDSYIHALIADMVRLLQDINAHGFRAYGLAAPQLGELVQLFVLSTPQARLIAMNPVVIKVSGQHNWIEGCLSLPGSLYQVSRPKLIKFQYMDVDAKQRSAKFHDDFSGICQHEIDHLSGRMIDSIGKPISRKAIFQS